MTWRGFFTAIGELTNGVDTFTKDKDYNDMLNALNDGIVNEGSKEGTLSEADRKRYLGTLIIVGEKSHGPEVLKKFLT